MNLYNVIIAAIIGYSFGCIQTAFIIGKLVKKIDIRQHGSNNAGASNVTNVLGWKYGVITALVDILKAVAAVIVIKVIFPDVPELVFVAGVLSILGHIFPIYLKFKGGKGTASLIGMFLAIDIKIALLLAAILIILTLVTDYIAVGAIFMFVTAPIAVYIFNYLMLGVGLCIILTIVCFFKHYINIVRIIHGNEVGLRKVVNKHSGKRNDVSL